MSISFPHFSSCTIVPKQHGDYLGINTFTSHPTPEEERERGTLFGFFLISYEHRKNDEILESIVAELEQDYYGRVFPPEGLEECFEQTIQNINQKILDEVQSERFFLNLHGLHGVMGVIRKKDILFTTRGDVRTLLFHERKDDTPLLIDLLDKTTKDGGRETQTAPTKLFAHLLSGQITEHETVLFCTRSLTDAIDDGVLKAIMRELPIAKASNHLKMLLKKNRATVPFLALTLSIAPERVPTEEQELRGSEASIDQLIDQEKRTKSILSASLLSLFAKRTAGTLETFQIPTQTRRITTLFFHGTLLGVKWLLKLGRSLIRLLLIVARLSIALAKKQTSLKEVLLKTRDEVSHELQQQTLPRTTIAAMRTRFSQWFFSLSRERRLLVVIGGIATMILFVSIITLRFQQQRASERARFEETWSVIEQKKENALAGVIYQEEEKTKGLLQEIQELIKILPQNSRERRDRIALLENELKELQQRVRRVVESPLTLLTDFSARTKDEMITGITELDNHLYAYTKKNLIHRINEDNKEIIDIDAAPFLSAAIVSTLPLEKDSLLLLDANQQFRELKLEAKTIRPLDITFAFAGPKVQSMTLYNKRLYLLDTENQQITRHNKTKSGFDRGTPWVKDPNPVFNKARALAIDGVVYVLDGDGKIRKFVNGFEREPITLSVEPQLFEAQTMWSAENSPSFYILDQREKRIIVANKDAFKGPVGKLTVQYTFPALAKSPESIVVNEKKKIMYLLSENKVYTAPLTHLQK